MRLHQRQSQSTKKPKFPGGGGEGIPPDPPRGMRSNSRQLAPPTSKKLSTRTDMQLTGMRCPSYSLRPWILSINNFNGATVRVTYTTKSSKIQSHAGGDVCACFLYRSLVPRPVHLVPPGGGGQAIFRDAY